ncbi:MAG: VIT and VWA domain-containing protein [Fimbriimonadaceae bacterium]|nr:VIT and VWA domain-containing protein [Fimbriimonadaceae bacterium]
MLAYAWLAVGAWALQGGPAVDPGSLQILDSEGRPGVACPLKGTDVGATIEGFGARVVVVQTFTNPSPKPIEAIYTFPLPENSAVDGMRMFVGDRIIEGVIKKRAEARETYEKAKKEGKSAALLDQQRPNIFTQSVANIPPGAEIRVAITYVQILKFEKSEFEFVFPMVVGHRFTGATTPDPEKVSPPIVPRGTRSGANIRLTVTLDAGAPITSLSSVLHRVDVEREGATRARVQLANANEIPNRDFILHYSVAGDSVVGSLLTTTDPKKGGFFTLVLVPPKAPTESQVTPKEAILVIDQSGSQDGLPIEKSKALSTKAIDALNPNDTFNVVSFANTYTVLWPRPRPVTTANQYTAKQYVAKLEANGGTHLEEAVAAALTMPPDPKRPRVVLFNTDGYIGGEAEALKAIQRHRGNARIFTFGIGNSVNRYLIEAMSAEGRGDAEIVTLNADLDAAVDRLVQRTDSPILTDIDVSFEGVRVRDTLPRAIPDVFSETPVIVKGRYDRPGTGFVIVKGKLAGKPWQARYPVTFPSQGNSGSAIGSLWARAKVDDLELQQRFEEVWGQAPAQPRKEDFWKNAITGLALEFSIMTKYTSFVAVDKRIVNPGGQQETVHVPIDMADGVTYEGIFGKVDERLAPTNSPDTYRPGDPLLSIDAPQNARQVVAVFPEGDVKPLEWNATARRWEVRFDIPASFADGSYTVTVYIVEADGTRRVVKMPFEVSTVAPEMHPLSRLLKADTIRLELDPDPRWARISLLTPWGDRLEFVYDAATGKIRLDVVLPRGFEGGWFRLVGLDRAHNQAQMRILINARGEILKREPIR